MRVVIPMSGLGTRFREAGYNLPKPLIPVDGKPIIEHLLGNFPPHWQKIFICNEEHLEKTGLGKTLKQLAPGSEIISIQNQKKGPVWAVLEGLKSSPEAIPDDEPCIVNYCDFNFSWDWRHFEMFTQRTQCDGAVLCYRGFHPEYIRPTLYAYCREENGRILEIKEKGHFTPNRENEYASSGTYYFRSGKMVKDYFKKLMDEGPLLNGEGYVSLVYNHLIQDGLQVRVYEIPYFLQWGTPHDLKDYEYWSRVYSHYPFCKSSQTSNDLLQLLMPMAGRGSRFEGEIPKPLRQVLGKPMFLAAIEHLPKTERRVFVMRDGIGTAYSVPQ